MFEQFTAFERAISTADSQQAPAQELPVDPAVGANDEAPSRSITASRTGEALRAIEWHELTARLKAARDLRSEIRKDAVLCVGSAGASFGDAAASYFKGIGHVERPVNPDALEGRKASGDIPPPLEAVVATGDAREHE